MTSSYFQCTPKTWTWKKVIWWLTHEQEIESLTWQYITALRGPDNDQVVLPFFSCTWKDITVSLLRGYCDSMCNGIKNWAENISLLYDYFQNYRMSPEGIQMNSGWDHFSWHFEEALDVLSIYIATTSHSNDFNDLGVTFRNMKQALDIFDDNPSLCTLHVYIEASYELLELLCGNGILKRKANVNIFGEEV